MFFTHSKEVGKLQNFVGLQLTSQMVSSVNHTLGSLVTSGDTGIDRLDSLWRYRNRYIAWRYIACGDTGIDRLE